jgi:hypothetical protein
LRVVKEKGGHVVVLFRLRDGTELAALDTARMTPSTGLALSGPEGMSPGEVVLNLAPGRYVLACMSRDDMDAKRHLGTGERKVIVVAPHRGAGVTPPRATAEVHMLDFAFRAPERWRRGAHWVRVTSAGKEDHLLLVARLREGVTLREWAMSKPGDSVATPLTGVARTSPGGVVYFPLALSPGRYVFYCLIPHASSGTPHQKLGMFKEITVE